MERATGPYRSPLPGGGGPPRDGIPPIDSPTFETLSEASRWLEAREPSVRTPKQPQPGPTPARTATVVKLASQDQPLGNKT